MPKRRRDEEDIDREVAVVKRTCRSDKLNLLDISDEILLRILSHLPTRDLLRIECVSSRMRALATDRELWRALYLSTFIRPRSRRRPFARLRKNDGTIDWKARFRTKMNWARGKAHAHEMEIEGLEPGKPASDGPPILAQVRDGLVFTADSSGLRAWRSNHGTTTLQAQTPIETVSSVTCIAAESLGQDTNILLGFEDGTISNYVYSNSSQWRHISRLQSGAGPVVELAMASPYAMSLSRTKSLGIYHMNPTDIVTGVSANISTISRFRSDASFSPVSISLRHVPSGAVASVAYAFFRLHSGWSIGLQEIRLNITGQFWDSRAVAAEETTARSQVARRKKWEVLARTSVPSHAHLTTAPTSISYEHPYLLCTFADNTMMSFMVKSNITTLEIAGGRRLWGHSSAVVGAQVDNRGKAVSISCRGGELRVWELEDIMMGTENKSSLQVQATDAFTGVAAAIARRGPGLGVALPEVKQELEMNRRWIGFDEQQVAVFGDTADRRQILTLYDFR